MLPYFGKRRLADAFARRVREEVPQFLEKIDKLNRDAEGFCATNDYVDANELMADAWREVFGEHPDVGRVEVQELWNAAWELASERGFDRRERVDG